MNAPAHRSMAGLLAARARGRLKPGERNKTEAAYERHLEGLKASGDVLWFAFEFITLKLAARTTYTADFAVMRADGAMELHEVKGNRWEDDARVKTKVAAAMSPFRIVAVRALPKKAGGGWEVEEF